MMAGNDNPGNPRRSEYCGGGLCLRLMGEVFKYPIAAIVPLGATWTKITLPWANRSLSFEAKARVCSLTQNHLN